MKQNDVWFVSRMRYRIPIPGFGGSFAWLKAIDEVDDAAVAIEDAAVFVHGFGGDPFYTWALFQDMVDRDSAWDRTDVYFFAYDSVGNRIRTSANRLVEFVDQTCSGTSPGIVGPGPRRIIRREGSPYRALTLVGHSEGGLVIRNAVVELITDIALGRESSSHLMTDAAVRLFAPAIAGASLAGWLGAAQGFPGLHALIRARTGASAAYKDMQEHSTVVTQTRQRTVDLERDPATNYAALTADILWADNDKVVTMARYPHDREAIEPNKKHGQVCKPGLEYDRPMEVVLRGV